MHRQPENEEDYVNPTHEVAQSLSVDHQPVTIDNSPTHQSTVSANKEKTLSDEYEITSLHSATYDKVDFEMKKNPAYADSGFK